MVREGKVFIKNKAKVASKWVVVREESCILESPIRSNSLLEELTVRRPPVIQEEIW